VMSALRTWTFSPAQLDGHAVDSRIGLVFQFPQSFLTHVTPSTRKFDEPMAGSPERGALPVYTVEPSYPVNSTGEGSVVLFESIDQRGQIASTTTMRDVPSLTEPTAAAIHDWKFVPGKQDGMKADSAVVVVVTFRRPTL
jgi:hypothetical protein